MFAEGVYAFSERVAIGVQKAGLSGIKFFPIEFEYSENKHLDVETAPPLYWGLVTGRVGVVEITEGIPQPRFEMVISDWDGSDFVAFKGRQTGFRFVSSQFVRLASEQQWTGIHFSHLLDGHILDLNKFSPPVKFPFSG